MRYPSGPYHAYHPRPLPVHYQSMQIQAELFPSSPSSSPVWWRLGFAAACILPPREGVGRWGVVCTRRCDRLASFFEFPDLLRSPKFPARASRRGHARMAFDGLPGLPVNTILCHSLLPDHDRLGCIRHRSRGGDSSLCQDGRRRYCLVVFFRIHVEWLALLCNIPLPPPT